MTPLPVLIAVTGATGQLGAQVLAHLTHDGGTVRALTRDPARLPSAPGIDARRADFAAPATVTAALAGVHTVLVISVEGEDEQRLALHRQAFAAAAQSGARRIVYTSFIDVAEQSPFTAARVHRLSEEAARATGLACTFLRCGPYVDNLARRIVQGVRNDGVYRNAAGDTGLPFIARADIALACAAALRRSGARHEVFTLAGPELLTVAELTALVGNAICKPLRCEPVDDATYAEALRQQGLAPALVGRGVSYARAMREGWLSLTRSDFEQLVGRPAARAVEVLPSLGLAA